jgi:hypothetical protein
MTIKAGRFEISVGEPYPITCSLYFDDKEIAFITHKDLSDLEYIIKKAKKECIMKLPVNRSMEV